MLNKCKVIADPANPGIFGDITRTTGEINLSRVAYVCGVILVLQIMLIAINGPYLSADTRIGVLTVSSSCLIYLCVILSFRKKILAKVKRMRMIYRSFWGALILAMIPYFIYDAHHVAAADALSPVNMLLFSVLLAIAPMFTAGERVGCFLLFLVVHLTIALVMQLPASYIQLLLGLCASGLLLSYFVYGQYQDMIVCFNNERRTDVLCGVLNRRGGMEKARTILESSKRTNKPLTVYMVDIDDFKAFNDSFGHSVGDTILKMVADALAKVFTRESDVLFRYGGEEFYILALEGAAQAPKTAERILQAVREIKLPEKWQVKGGLSVSVGYVIYDPESHDYFITDKELFEQTDAAMYMAKTTGKDRAVEIKLRPPDD